MNQNFIKQVIEYLFPIQNRVIAAVAFVRTFGQTLAGVFTVGAGGLIVISVDNLQAIDWSTVGWTAAALVLSAILSGAKAFSDVSRNGLNSKYLESVQVDSAEIQKAVTVARPKTFVPAPVKAPAKATAPKKAAPKKVAAKKEETPELKGGIAKMAPAVEISEGK